MSRHAALKETSFLSGLVSKFEGLLSGSDGRSTAERTDATHPLTAAEPAGPAEESTRCADVTGPGDLPDDNTTKSTTGGDQVDQGSARAPGDILTEPPTTTIGQCVSLAIVPCSPCAGLPMHSYALLAYVCVGMGTSRLCM